MLSYKNPDWKGFCVLTGFENNESKYKNLKRLAYPEKEIVFILNQRQYDGFGDIKAKFKEEVDIDVEEVFVQRNTNSGNNIYLFRGVCGEKTPKNGSIENVFGNGILTMSCCGANITVSQMPPIRKNYEIILLNKKSEEKLLPELKRMMALNVVGNLWVIPTSYEELRNKEDDL